VGLFLLHRRLSATRLQTAALTLLLVLGIGLLAALRGIEHPARG
jgi:hypothetical protein